MTFRPRWHHLQFAVLACAMLALSAWLAPASDSGDGNGARSTHNTGPHGLQALQRAAEALDIAGDPLHLAPADWGADIAAVAVAGPPAPGHGDGTENVEAWVKGGGRLLVAGAPGWDWCMRRFGLAPMRLPYPAAVRAGPGAAEWGLEGSPGNVDGAFASVPVGATVLLEAGEEGDPYPVAVAFFHGEGRVVALADASLLATTSLRQRDAAVAALRLVEHAAGDGRLRFAEAFHGYVAAGSPWGALVRIARTTPFGRAAFVAALFLLAWLAGGATRTGRVRRVLAPPRRSEREFLDATAGMLAGSGAWRETGEFLLQGFRRRLRLAPRPTSEDAADEVARVLGWDRPESVPALREAATALLEVEDPARIRKATALLDGAVERRDSLRGRDRRQA